MTGDRRMLLAKKDRTIPNLLSLLRIFLALLFLPVAHSGHREIFLVIFGLALISDAMDGYLARRLHQTSELGARLDSWGDCAVYCATPVALWWLWPEIIHREAFSVGLAIAAFILPIAIGLNKYRRLTSYHTMGAKIAAVLLAVTTPLLLLGGPAWPLRVAVLVLLAAEIEEIGITLTLPAWRSDVRSLWHARRMRQEETYNCGRNATNHESEP